MVVGYTFYHSRSDSKAFRVLWFFNPSPPHLTIGAQPFGTTPSPPFFGSTTSQNNRVSRIQILLLLILIQHYPTRGPHPFLKKTHTISNAKTTRI